MGAPTAGDELAAWERAEAARGGGGGKEERILVSVRLRPLNAKEAERGDSCDWECISPTTVMFKNTMPPATYTYDRVFGCDCSTRQVYEEGAKEVALSVVSGINSSVFAYGQTSSGKTYTMTGITEYSVADIYGYIEKHSEREFILKFSAMEIYNEAVRDLLSHDMTPLRLLDDPEKGTIVEKLTEETLRDQNHLRDLLSVCEAQRQIGETSLNEMSSRSHQILRLTIESSSREFLGRGSASTLVACVNFVDLAGSERASQTASAGMRLKEGSHINRSLLTLGKVVRQLSKGRNGHIPYRDSKLTRILQSSLGGNARTAVICTVSPAHSHVEQSRNTLLFASCAKEIVTNAQVNVFMSDKALVKHLQRELARLENEMKFPGSASCSTHAEALREKDAQIKKLERELKELMQQRDLAQSQLEDFLRGVGDDHGDDHTLSQWDECSRSSGSHVRNASEDALSASETYGMAYQDQDLGSTVFDASYACNSDHDHLEIPERSVDQHSKSLTQSPNSHSSGGIDQNQEQEVASRAASDNCEEHCKEVQCIEINLLSRSGSQGFSFLLPEEPKSLLQLTNADKLEVTKVEEIAKQKGTNLQSEDEQQIESVLKTVDDSVKSYSCEIAGQKDTNLQPEEEQQINSVTKTVDGTVKPYQCESNMSSDNSVQPYPSASNLSFDLGKPFPDEYSMLKRCIVSSRDGALTRSRSCRATFMIGPNSWFDYLENADRTPPDLLFKYVPPPMPEKVRRSLYTQNDDYLHGKLSVASEKFMSDEVVVKENNNSNAEDDGTINVISCVIAQETTEKYCSEQLHDDQTTNEDFGVEKTVKDVGIDSAVSAIESPSRWPIDFEKKQQEIIELWHTCNVSLVHRTYFFLLFKGDPADSIYMEVERRRLSFLKNSFIGNAAKLAADGELTTAVASSLKNLRREREMLYRQMLKKLPLGERVSLYTKWGIALKSKQRRLQLSRRIWTLTDMEHIRESASLVAKLIEFVEPGQGLKEMFGLSFTLTPQTDRRSFSWIGAYSLK